MKEPSEELLDRHFRQQVASYKDVDQALAKQSDRLIIARWMKVFEKIPLSQKLARNSLMLLMHGHLKDFGVLKEPFTDVRNCSRNLNVILDEYRGQPCKNASRQEKSMGSAKSVAKQKQLASGKSFTHNLMVKMCSTQILRPRNLEPIQEVTEPSEKEPTTSSFASIVTVVRQPKSGSSGSKKHLDSQRTGSECADRQSVKQRVQSLGDEPSRNTQHPLRMSSMENIRNNCQKSPGYCGDSTSNRDELGSGKTRSSSPLSQEKLIKITNVIEQVNRRSSAVKNLTHCFEEMAERLKNTIKSKSVAPMGHKPKIPPPKTPKKFNRIHQDVSPQPARQPVDKCHPPVCFEDINVQDLLIRREKLRVQCLAYYNLDGTMKHVKDMPDPPMNIRKAEQRVRGFIIGAYRALERLKRWRGKSKQLRFFQTCFQKCGLGDFWELQAADRRFERVALKWYRRKVMASQRNTWRIYRRNILGQKISYAEEDLQQMRHQLELQEELQRERMVHLAKIKELCRTNCCGIIKPEVLCNMLNRLDDEHAQLAEDLKVLLRQKEQLFQ
ncbi:uncharacterized protein LOC6544393 [Drosophila erecta]|uniref:DUF4485 domain-containing protein n=1 Tax=Drosophila erecta TaxID=7220 RepID=B3NFV8_DROER|nr:uncharacterized protein LOC6544393 [Drosophila erecta]EDV50720.1 uncharacterized protein Dere_GG14288 [Drosophila erecta]